MIAYLSQFLPHHSHVSAPLRDLLKNDVAFCWTSAQDAAFPNLRSMISFSPALAYYSSDAETIVFADASSYGIGAALFQLQDDDKRAPVGYVSRSLTSAEERYSQIEKEALAMAWACDKFECYLLGKTRAFIIETDHKPLRTIMNSQPLDQCPPRLQRLKMYMMLFYAEVVYVPGKSWSWLMHYHSARWKTPMVPCVVLLGTTWFPLLMPGRCQTQ
jgi:hypothetical protein